jgi:hypothetical protein
MQTTGPMIDIQELRRLYEAATPGPWHWRYDDALEKWTIAPGILIADHTDGTPGGDELDVANANLIPAMHAAFPFLLAEAADAARLRLESDLLRASLREIALQDAARIARDPDLPRRIALNALQWREEQTDH